MGKQVLKEKFLERFKFHWGKTMTVCMELKITPACYSLWKKKDPTFAEAIVTLKKSFVEEVEGEVRKKIFEEHDNYWIREWLRVHSPNWAKPILKETNHSGQVSIRIINAPAKPEVD